MSTVKIVGALLIVAVALALVGEHDRRQDAASYWRGKYDAERVETKQWQARFAAASSHVQHDVDTVRVRVTRVDSLRDTVLQHLTDTLTLIRYVTATDSALRACTELADSCTVFRHVADSTLAAKDRLLAIWEHRYDAVKPRFRDRFGIGCGYGVQQSGGVVRAGPQCGVTFKVWP